MSRTDKRTSCGKERRCSTGKRATSPPTRCLREPSDGGDGWGDDPGTTNVDESLNDDYGDLHLSPGSPAIDAGSNSLLPADEHDLDGDGDVVEPLPFDLGGNPRIQNGTVDIGAYEYEPSPPATVTGHRVFYNHSAWDGNDVGANAADDNAIVTDRIPLLPGQTATFANYTSYDKGINGLMIDVRSLCGTPTVDDFLFRVGNNNTPYGNDPHSPADDWPWAPAPTSINVRPGTGLDGADRITLIWADGVIRNKWLQVTVLATDNTGLAMPDVFYFGNAVGESGNSPTDALVNATDEIGARNNPHSPFNPAPIDDPYDFNRDKLVNATDQIIARNNRTSPFTALKLITPPLEDGGSGEGEGEWSGDMWTTWSDSSLFESNVLLDNSVARRIVGRAIGHRE